MRAVPLNTVHLPKAVGRAFNQRQGRRDSHPPKVSFHPALETTARPHPEARRKARHERAPASRSTPHLSPTPAPRPQSPGAVGVEREGEPQQKPRKSPVSSSLLRWEGKVQTTETSNLCFSHPGTPHRGPSCVERTGSISLMFSRGWQLFTRRRKVASEVLLLCLPFLFTNIRASELYSGVMG